MSLDEIAKQKARLSSLLEKAEEPERDLDKSLDEGIYDAEDELQKARPDDLYTEDMSSHHGKKVFAYYNLASKVWSVRHEGKVIAHTKQLHLKDVKFKVSEAGRQKVLNTKTKNVHAGVVGTLTEPRKMPDHKTRVSYNPYNAGHFYDADHKDKPAIHDAAHVHMEVNEGTDPNGHQVRFPRVHALRNTAAKLRKAKIDALAKAEEKKWPTEAAPKLEFSTTPPPTPGQGPHSLSLARTKHGEYRVSHTMNVKRAGRDGDRYYESDPGGENHSVHYEPKPELGPGGEYSHIWSRYLGDFPSKEAAFQHAHGDHVARHYGLSPDDVAAANKAWPEHGLSRFVGAHPEMVRSEMERARSSFKKVSDWRDRLHKMAIKDIKPGKRVHSKEEEYLDDRPPKIYDYSHVLSPKHRKAGYSVELTHYDGGDGSFNVHVRHRGKAVGHIEGEPYERDPKTLWVNNAQIEPKHRGKGLGTAGYEALYGHAKNVLGFKHAAGGLHSSMASKVHQRLAEKHGLKYRPQANPLGALDHRLAPRTTGEYDQQLGPYSYALKSETVQKMAIQDLKPAEHKLGGEYDYSHVLTPEHRSAGYTMSVKEVEPVGSFSHEVQVHLRHGGKTAGGIQAYSKNDQAIHPGIVSIHQEHRGKKLGTAMYEALYAHAKHKLGMTHAEGGGHSPSAVRVHQSLARKHGLEYKHEPPDFSEERGSPYKYALKSER